MPTLQESAAHALTLIRNRQGDVSAAEIAELFRLSERRARFYLAKVTGKNLRTLCVEARLAPARPRVRATNQPIEALARAFGYPIASETIYGINPATGSDVQQGKKEYFYDDYSLTNRGTSVPNHTGSATASGRGNLTRVRTYKDSSNYLETQMKYDSVGNLVETIDPLSHSTTVDFTDNFTDTSKNGYKFAYPKKVTNALGQYATSEYDFNTGLVKKVTNLRGNATTTVYDSLNRITSITEPAVGGTSKVTTYDYDDSARTTVKKVTVDTASNKGQVDTYFDKLYRTTRTVTNDPGGAIAVDTEYDENGRVKKTSNPYRSGETVVWTQTAYDALSRPATVTAPDNSTVSYAYANNVTTTTDQAGNQRRYTYNVLGQMSKVEEPNPTLSTPVATSYSYYVFGPLYKSSQSGQTRTWVYNWLGQMTSQTLPESGTTSFIYDSGGRFYSKTDARGVITVMTYDNANRLTSRSYSDGTPTVTFTYDGSSQTGLRTAMSDGLGSVAYTYDTRDRLTQESRTLTGISGTFSTSYVYNVKGDVTQMTYPSGRVVNFGYATGGGCCNSRLSSLVDGTTSTTLLNGIAFNAAGGVTSQTLNPGSNAITETFTYDPYRLQLTGIQAAKGSTTVMDFTYNYGTSSTNTGRVLSRTDAIQPEHSANYLYDSLYRLSRAAGADNSWALYWVFDAYGNRTTQTPSGLATSKAGSQTLGYSNNKNISFTYDNSGNTINDTVHTYAYNAENQQISSTGGTAATYAYDGEGRRMKKSASGVSTYYFYGEGGLLCEFSTSTSDSSATAASSSDKTIYRTSEKTGSAVLLFNTSGLVIENNRTLPYGEAWLSDVASANDKKFTTYDRDKETGLDYAMARMYGSTGGRFTSPDQGPVIFYRPSTLNRYVYGELDPINQTDRTGNRIEPGPEAPRPSPPAGYCAPQFARCGVNPEYSTVPVPGPVEKKKRSECPPDKKNFFTIATPVLQRIATDLSIDVQWLLAQASIESGYLQPSKQLKHNLLGVSDNEIPRTYDSWDAMVKDWERLYKDDLQGATSFDDYISRLKQGVGPNHKPYNSAIPNYYEFLKQQLGDMEAWQRKCDD